MDDLTWLDLYNLLHKIANDIKTVGEFKWNEPVLVHNAETGDEYPCDTWIIDDNKLVLAINTETIFREIGDGKE